MAQGTGGTTAEVHAAILGIAKEMLEEAASFDPKAFGRIHTLLEIENGLPVFSEVTKTRKRKLSTARK